MKKGIDQTLAWIGAVFFAGSLIGSFFFLSKYLKEHRTTPEGANQNEIAVAVEKPRVDDSRYVLRDGNPSDTSGLSKILERSKTELQERHAPPLWDYQGPRGPKHWGSLDSAYAACNQGSRQSPIDIRAARTGKNPPSLHIHYREADTVGSRQQHGLHYKIDDGGYITYDGIEYSLQTFHWHTPSEHRIDGTSAELEVHLVHSDAKRNKLVLAILLNGGGSPFSPLRTLINTLPPPTGNGLSVKFKFNPEVMMPKDKKFYYYEGSLTTPPCAEGVQWVIMKAPLLLSDRQVDALIRRLKYNARPIQSLDQRIVHRSF